MDASLCRRLTQVMQSPYYFKVMQGRDDEAGKAVFDNLVAVCTQADIEEDLPEDVQAFFEKCDRSQEIADQKGYQYPYSDDEVNDVAEAMNETDF